VGPPKARGPRPWPIWPVRKSVTGYEVHHFHNFTECLSIRQADFHLNLVSLYRTRITQSFTDGLITFVCYKETRNGRVRRKTKKCYVVLNTCHSNKKLGPEPENMNGYETRTDMTGTCLECLLFINGHI